VVPVRIRDFLTGYFPPKRWLELRAYSGGRCTCCGYPKELTVDRAPAGPVRGLVCEDCRNDLARIEAGEMAPEGLHAEYLANPWRPSV